jgi:hypothetical protein
VSTGSSRRLDSVARRHDGAVEARLEARARERERKRQLKWETKKQAAIAMVAFAQVLAGTVMQPPGNAPTYEPPPRPAPVKRDEPKEPWRPNQHTETTWQKAMSVPWIEGDDHGAPSGVMMVERPPEKSIRPKDWVDPYPGGDFRIPSYAGEPEDEDEAK